MPDCVCSENPIVFYVHFLSDSYLIKEFRTYNFCGKFCDTLGDCSHYFSDILEFKKGIVLSKLI